jgi:Rha family phage regulatory protein
MDTTNAKSTAPASLVRIVNNQPTTTSLVIAKKFKKLHKNVIQGVDNLEYSTEFRRLNFQPTYYLDEQGKVQPCYEMSRDGFMFLVMGFTGKKAAQWKEEFIGAFNWQANEINRLRTLHASPDWQLARIDGKAYPMCRRLSGMRPTLTKSTKI